ncbi:MAG: hypothetical protein JWR51_2226 [Devosia sp.]|uniref:hypothetical protein n=1 Tax=Devosia sp. TaxID=1871048 RepID=UPI0026115CB1|nr:hypothetical protein [Devosia sp.]MDB5529123.1 hypothetical protein [Devosia sp.]
MIFRSACILAFAMVAIAANGAECRLDQAHYVEPVSGATMQFHPTTPDLSPQTMAVFDVALPNVTGSYAGEITWNAGNNARPDPSIKGLLDISTAYSIDYGSVGLIDDREMLAPPSILLVDFGRALHGFGAFLEVNPDSQAFDVFTLTGCP